MTDRELMQQALDLLDDINECSLPPTGIPLPAEIDHVMEALRARLAQPEPEPVAWLHTQGHVSEASDRELFDDEIKHGWTQKPLYTALPQREWQGLMDEDWIIGKRSADYIAGAEWAEAKLKEKNT